MKNQILLISLMLGLMLNTSGQTIDLTFTAVDNESYVQLDSIKIMNRTQGGDTVLSWPDTVLSLIVVGLDEPQLKESAFQVFQNYPNPVVDQTIITFYIPSKDQVDFMVTDILGRVVMKDNRVLDKGTHSFRFSPGKGNLYFFTAQWRGQSSSIKILKTTSNSNGANSLEYIGSEVSSIQLKETEDIQSFLFNIGDELLYIGYTNDLQAGILDDPETSEFFTFQFAYDIPCPGTPTVSYEGQEYNTVQIFNQCWLKENLNVGTMTQGAQNMSDNGVIEKYCYDNLETNCDEWGGLYQWDEMMKYSNIPAIQGICPPDWHIPTDEELKVLEAVIDSQYGIGDPEWDWWDMRGSDIGDRIKSQSGWYTGLNGSDSHGFTLLSSGFRYSNGGLFHAALFHASLWTSSEHTGEYKWFRYVIGYIVEIYRYSVPKEYGNSVRCVRD